jgi:hypothetical protein
VADAAVRDVEVHQLLRFDAEPGSVSGPLTVNFDGLSPITFPGGAYTSATLGVGQL